MGLSLKRKPGGRQPQRGTSPGTAGGKASTGRLARVDLSSLYQMTESSLMTSLHHLSNALNGSSPSETTGELDMGIDLVNQALLSYEEIYQRELDVARVTK